MTERRMPCSVEVIPHKTLNGNNFKNIDNSKITTKNVLSIIFVFYTIHLIVSSYALIFNNICGSQLYYKVPKNFISGGASSPLTYFYTHGPMPIPPLPAAGLQQLHKQRAHSLSDSERIKERSKGKRLSSVSSDLLLP